MRMETFIRKALGLKAYKVTELEDGPERVVARIDRIPGRHLRCGGCEGEVSLVVHRQAEREWRDLSLRDRPLVLVYAPWRVRCPVCGVRVEKVPWAGRWQRITDALLAVVARLARRLSWKETAQHYGLDWKTVVAAVHKAVAWGLGHRRWKPLRVLGIDEVSRSKGQRYLTLVYDLERGRLVWVGENRDAETMRRFFEWLGPRRARSILIVCCDMWAVYVDAIREKLPQAFIVFDRFHVVQHLNRAVDEVRRECWRQLTGEERSAFKKTRWLWLKNPWNLRAEEKRRLSILCRQVNQPIVRAYYLKEAFQRFWDYKAPGWSEPYLRHWLWAASHSRLAPFVRFARMIRQHLDGILRWTQLSVANGALEGMNNKVKVISHRAYGFRKVDTYITAIWHACGDLPLP